MSKTLKISPLGFFALSMLSAAALLGACTAKDRDSSFQQGQGENLLLISDYDGKTFEIQTADISQAESQNQVKNKLEIQSAQKNVSVEGQTSQALPLVSFTTTAKLLQPVPLRGRPQFKYTALYRVTDNYLKIYQVGKKADIDRDQQTYAETLPDGRLAVPLMGYPIKGFFNVEKIKNSDNEDTNKLSEFSKERDQAQQFRIDLNAAQIFESVAKENLMRASYFTGDWYFAATIVEASEADKGNLGYELALDEMNNAANRIKFSINETNLTAQNVNVDDRLDKKNEINLQKALSIPVQWKDFELAARGRDKDLREREDAAKAWNQRRYLQLSLAQTQSATSHGEGRLTGLEVTDDYFAYTLQLEKQNIRIRYSFLRVAAAPASAYIPKKHLAEDFKKFGFFTTEKSRANNFEIQHKEDLSKSILISRFNPKAGKIIFHFTKTSPDWARVAARPVIAAWDQAFVSAGTSLRIALDESFDVELGDIRYNAINLIESLTSGDLFGFGPSVADSLTGEIISATTNLHLTPIREALAREVRNFVRSELGLLNANYSQGISAMMSGLSEIEVPAAKPATVGAEADKAVIQGNFLRRPMTLKAPTFDSGMGKVKNIEFRHRATLWGREKDLSITSKNIHQEIRTNCAEVKSYVEELKASGKTFNDKENSVLDSCARKIMTGKIQGTLVHEMGHNFGLRHNFMGSVDKENFWPKETTGTESAVRSSSVMEYPAFNEDRLSIAGEYDIAAIRYGYADAVLLADKKTVFALNTNLSIAENLKERSMRPFMFCTDEDVMNSTNPLCARWDAGTTPQEIVENHIQGYHTSTALLNYRYDHLSITEPFELMVYRMETYMMPMRRFYEEWRLQLGKYVGSQRRYLQGMNDAEYQLTLEKMSKDPQYSEIYKAYKPTADRIYSFFKAIAMMSNRYCVVQNGKGEQSLLELDSVREEVYRASQVSIKSCTEKAATAHFATAGLTALGQSGYFLNDLRFDLNPDKVSEPMDVIGSTYDRWISSILMTYHESQSLFAQQQNFRPSFMDEPIYRKDWSETLESRVLKGVDSKAIQKIVPSATALAEYVALFGSEKALLVSQFEDLFLGLGVPDDLIESKKRRQSYESSITSTTGGENAAAITAYSGSYNFVAQSESAKFAIELAETYENLKNSAAASELQIEDLKAGVDFINENLPAQVDVNAMTVEKFSEVFEAAARLRFKSSAAQRIWYSLMSSEQRQRMKIDLKKNTFGIYGDKETERIARFNASPIKDVYQGSTHAFEISKEQYLARLQNLLGQAKAASSSESQIEMNAKMDLLNRLMYRIAD